jgi:hypothetical protein
MWPSIDPLKVNLDEWQTECGSVGCFGGWVTRDPHFQQLGVRASRIGGPMMLGGVGSGVAEILFGDRSLFRPRDDHPADHSPYYGPEPPRRMSDHECVTARLQYLLDRAEVEP